MRRWVTAFAAIVLGVVALVGGFLAGTGRALPGGSSAPVTKVTVTATDFKFRLSKSRVPKPGKVAFKVVNKGKVGHAFKIAGKKTKLLQPGQSQTLTATFGKSGSYVYRCTVSGHAQSGMTGAFTVSSKPVTTSTSTTTDTGTTTDPGY